MATRDGHALINYLVRTRIKQGKSQADICRVAGISKSSLSGWESHKKEPVLSSIVKWARALDSHMVVLNEMFSDDPQPQLREVTEYGVTWDKGPREGEVYAPSNISSICYWNRSSRIECPPRLLIRTRLEVAEEVEFRHATDEEIDHWNNHIMAPHVLKGREYEEARYGK